MKKYFLIFFLFCAEISFAASVKASGTCSKPKNADACIEELSGLAKMGISGDTASITLFESTMRIAQKNKAFVKPVMESVDTVLWESCKKKDREKCLVACAERTDSSFARFDAPDSAACVDNPQNPVSKKIKVARMSPTLFKMDSLALDAFWNAPFDDASRWLAVLRRMNSRIAISDSLYPDINFALRNLLAGDPADFAYAKMKFSLCAAFGDSLNTLLDSAEAKVRCPVIGRIVDSRDNRSYRVKLFGEKIWMLDNAAFDVPDSSACYDGDSLNCENFERLYTFGAAKMACPEGFREATVADYDALFENSSADFSVTVKFGGYFNQNGISTLENEGTYWWTSDEEDSARGFVRNLFSDANAFDQASVDKRFGLSVRCVQE